MTFISPSAPAVSANITRNAAPEGRAGSLASFAGLLDDPETVLQPHRNFAFDELGMFGRRETQSPPTFRDEKRISDMRPQTAHTSATKNTTGARYDSTGSPAQNTDAPSHGVQQAPDRAPLEPVGEQASSAAQMQGAVRQTGATSVSSDIRPALYDSVDELSVAPEDGKTNSAAAASSTFAENGVTPENTDLNGIQNPQRGGNVARSALPLPPNRTENPVALLVSGSTDALVVTARSRGETAEGFIKLRQLVEDTAADFGMDVAEFHLNGAASGPSFKSIAGGQHGSRTR